MDGVPVDLRNHTGKRPGDTLILDRGVIAPQVQELVRKHCPAQALRPAQAGCQR